MSLGARAQARLAELGHASRGPSTSADDSGPDGGVAQRDHGPIGQILRHIQGWIGHREELGGLPAGRQASLTR